MITNEQAIMGTRVVITGAIDGSFIGRKATIVRAVYTLSGRQFVNLDIDDMTGPWTWGIDNLELIDEKQKIYHFQDKK